ncbi:MAG: VWA domain-containing protein [Thermoanaerobaculia bacterium]|nr:VWA domain-containing protein [Thermoanaerobaculia bacterium]
MSRKALLALALLLSVTSAAQAALNFEFTGERSGNPPIRFAGQGFIDDKASRYDFIAGNHAIFRKDMSILTTDNKVLTVVDHSRGTWFKRSTKGMAGIITTYQGPWQVGADQFEIELETLDRESWLGVYRPVKHRLKFSYRLKMKLEGEEFLGTVEADAELWLDPKYRVPAVPWGHQFGLKTGIEEFDAQIAKKVQGLGFPFRQLINVTRTIEGGERITESLRTDVTRFGDTPFSWSGFHAPGGYLQVEPTFSRPEFKDAAVETAQATPPPPTQSAPEPALPITQVDPKKAVPILVESVEVRVVNVDAVVTDKSGKHAPGLRKEDFEVREGGQPREITNFLEVSTSAGTLAPREAAGAEAAPVATAGIERRARKIVLFLDQNTLQFHNRNRVIGAASAFVMETMRPGDEAMIVTFDKGMKIPLQFTGDPAVVAEALGKLKDETVGGVVTSQRRARAQNQLLQLILDAQMRSRAGAIELPTYSSGLSVCTVYAAAVMHDANQTIGALQGLMTALSPIPGRKVLVIATEALPARAGEDMFVFFDRIKENFEGGSSQNPITEISRYDLATKVQAVSDTANASGFTLYPIFAKGLADDSAGADMAGSLQMNFGQAVNASSDVARSNDSSPLLTLANLTGGRMSMGGNNLAPAFEGISIDLENYYSIGYRPEGERSGMPRSVVVKVNKPDLRVRTKASFLERTLENEIEETVAAALFYPVDRNDLGVTISTSAPELQADGTMRTKLRIVIPTASMALLPQGDDLAGSIVAYIGFVKADGGVSKIAKNSQQFSFPAATASRRKNITVELDVTADASTNRIAVGVLDQASKSTGFASTFLGAAPGAQ